MAFTPKNAQLISSTQANQSDITHKLQPTFKERFIQNLKVAPKQVLLEPLIGAGKGVLSSISGASQLGQKGLQTITGIQAPISRLPEKFTTPTTVQQFSGFVPEQIGEFFIPGAAGTKISKAISGAKLLKNVPKLAKTAGLAGRVGTEATTFGGITGIQEGTLKGGAKESALIGGLLPVAGAATSVVGKKLSSRVMNSLIKPPSKEFRFGKDPGLAVAKEGIKANTLEGLLNKIRGKKQEIGKQLGKTVKSSEGIFDAEKLILDTAGKEGAKMTNDAVVKKFNNVLDQLFFEVKFTREGLTKVGTKDLTKLTSEKLHLLQRKIGELTTWTEPAIDKPVNAALAKIYRSIGKQLEKMSPGTKPLQKRYANLLGAEKSVQMRENATKRSALIANLGPLGIGGAVGLGSFIAGEGDRPLRSAIQGSLALAGAKFAGGTAVKSRLANILAKSRPKTARTIGAGIAQSSTNQE